LETGLGKIVIFMTQPSTRQWGTLFTLLSSRRRGDPPILIKLDTYSVSISSGDGVFSSDDHNRPITTFGGACGTVQ
jgi:hypothetical protein